MHRACEAGGYVYGECSNSSTLAAPAGKEAELFSVLFSPTPDWGAKVQWLLAKGYPRTLLPAGYPDLVAPCSYAVQRLEWVRASGWCWARARPARGRRTRPWLPLRVVTHSCSSTCCKGGE